MGIVGSVIIATWSFGLLRDSGQVLLDAEEHGIREAKIRTLLQDIEDDIEIADLHVWRVGMASYACIVSLVVHTPHPLQVYKQCLANVPGLDHITVEVNTCCTVD